MTTAVLIVAAGRGERAGGEVAKQWRPIGGCAMIEHTIAAFQACPEVDRIALVLPADDDGRRAGFENRGFIVALGGGTRSESVRNGLESLKNTDTSKVLIHDAARPCTRQNLIGDVIAALDRADAAAPALAITDALWTGEQGHVIGTQTREGLFRAQTPQGFGYVAICAAYQAFTGEAADDVAVARAHGLKVVIVQGDEDNLKVTLPGDFARAERILGNGMDIRLGNGFDVHRFDPGVGGDDYVTLCGVQVPHDRGLQGHSDADVGMHAVTDAIYGALAAGDIGQHFPPSDPQWKGAASDIFLSHAAGLATGLGYRIGNVDCTLICEFPKIGPHAAAMRAAMAGVLGLEVDQVSVKATTSERLGFTGRGEGIAAMATATLVRP